MWAQRSLFSKILEDYYQLFKFEFFRSSYDPSQIQFFQFVLDS